MDFQIEISLKRFAMVSYVGSLWNKPHIQHMLFEESYYGNYTSIYYLIDIVKNELKTEFLPTLISTQLIDVIIRLGLAAFYWYKYAVDELYVSLELCYKIPLHWTVYGTIAKAKVENEWVKALERVKEDDKAKLRRLNFGLYYMACTSVQKSFINRHAQEMLNFVQGSLDPTSVNSEEFDLIKVNFIMHSVLFSKCDTSSESRRSKLTSMILLSVKQGHEVAVRYYWSLLDLQERQKLLVRAACELERKSLWPRRDAENESSVLFFFLQQMTKDQLESFISTGPRYKLKILATTIHSWSWEELFFPAFDLLIKYVSEIDMSWFLRVTLDNIIEAIACNYFLGVECKSTTCHEMFFTVWKEMENTEYNVLEPGDFNNLRHGFVLPGLFKGFDIRILNLVLGLRIKEREKYLEEGKIYYKQLMERGEYELIEEFMEVVLKSEKERAWFIKTQLDFIVEFKKESNQDAVQKILNWRASLGE